MGTPNTEDLSPPAAFLKKTYNIVNDPATDYVVEWMADGRSFLIKQTDLFEREIAPQYFKHSNFSSFVRQLNTYGFKKVDPDHWEFANEHFQRDRPELLGQIDRKRRQTLAKTQATINPAIEVGRFGDLASEVDSLKRDKKQLTKEVVRMRQQQQMLEHRLQNVQHNFQQVHQRTLDNEKQTKAMFRFVSKALHNPTFLNQIMQFQSGHNAHGNHSNEYLTHHNANGRKKRRAADHADNVSTGALVPYQPADEMSFADLMRGGDQAGPSLMIDNPGTGVGLSDMDSAFQDMGFENEISQTSPTMGLQMPSIPQLSPLAYGQEYREGDQPAQPSGHTFVEVSTPTSDEEPDEVPDFTNGLGEVQDWAGGPQDAALLNEMVKDEAEPMDRAEDWLQYLEANNSGDFLPRLPSGIAPSPQYGKLS